MLKKLLAPLALVTIALAAAGNASAQASAQNFPNKPIHIIVTFSSGGAPDIIARLIGERMGAEWGQSVIVDNKPGAGGNIGADFVAKSAPDGYNIVVGTVGTHSINGRKCRTT
jgi:tripartite-type tricarboxylate transporter receptor subunit TctC